jgi:hypothetical protein
MIRWGEFIGPPGASMVSLIVTGSPQEGRSAPGPRRRAGRWQSGHHRVALQESLFAGAAFVEGVLAAGPAEEVGFGVGMWGFGCGAGRRLGGTSGCSNACRSVRSGVWRRPGSW